MFHLVAYCGPRRGEACGLRDRDVHLAKREVAINNQITAVVHTIREKRPKSRASNRILVLDADTAATLAAYKARRSAWRLAAGPDCPTTGLFFVRTDGQPWHPNAVTARFRRLVRDADLPPVRLHDLRHVAATMALDAGVDIKVVQEQLGHSTSTRTRDTYQSVSKDLHREAADAVARRIANIAIEAPEPATRRVRPVQAVVCMPPKSRDVAGPAIAVRHEALVHRKIR